MKRIIFLTAFFFSSMTLTACSDDKTDPIDPVEYELTVEPHEISVGVEGSAVDAEEPIELTIRTTSTVWTVETNGQLWARPFVSSGLAATTSVRLIVDANTGEQRTARLTVSAPGCTSVDVVITQAGVVPVEKPTVDADLLPDYVAPVQTGVESDAVTLARRLHAGINIGNTLEACNNRGTDDMTQWAGGENTWGNPSITRRLIEGYKAAGFNAVRIPVAWVCGHISDHSTWKIDPEWMGRVREVVDYCYEVGDMYAIINIHWDGGWLENNPTYAKQEEVNAMQQRLWTQIAKAFRDYDEHLLFAGTNEVHSDYGNPSQENLTVQQSFNQTFVDAVRATGGRNAYRVLVTQAYNTNIWQAQQYHVMSTDPAGAGRMMLEVHNYDPWQFCLTGESQVVFRWGTDADKESLAETFSQVKKFVDAGYPVILGEYGALYASSHADDQEYLDSRCNWIEYATRIAKENGMAPFVWDTGGDVISRSTGSVLSHQTAYLEALMRGAEQGEYPF